MRADWNTYFMNIARAAATRSTCSRKHVGAVIVRDKSILSTGYNGSIPGMPHCTEIGCDIENGHCVATQLGRLMQQSAPHRRGASSLCWSCPDSEA